MLVVISDLHFEEESRDVIEADGPYEKVDFMRNLPVSAYQHVIEYLAADARRANAKRLDLVLAGDVFDLHRTMMWFDMRSRPYVDCDAVANDGDLESDVLRILREICKEERVARTLETLRTLASGSYFVEAKDRMEPFPVADIRLHYIPGNHDRLANSSPAIRRFVRNQLGIFQAPGSGTDDVFGHSVLCEVTRTLVRHGHEYDRYNFAVDHLGRREFPSEIPASHYAEASFGDFITVEIASRLPYQFRAKYDKTEILQCPLRRALYKRLLEFDDVRPQSALLDFLLATPNVGVSQKQIWRTLEPVAMAILDTIADNTFFRSWLKRLEKQWRPDAIDVVQTLLDTRAWRKMGLPLKMARFISDHLVSNRSGKGPEWFASREEVIRDGTVRFVLAGHTHEPQVALAAVNGTNGGPSAEERYFVDTGTWRNRVTATPDRSAFGRLKALTYVTIYGPNEDCPKSDGASQPKLESFDMWSGSTQRWQP